MKKFQRFAPRHCRIRYKWYPSRQNSHPEGEDSANKLCFRKEPFEDSYFEELTVFGPMLDLSSEDLEMNVMS